MSDDITKRDLQNGIEAIKQQSRTKPTATFKTEDGQYYDEDGNPIRDFSNIIFVVPPQLWQRWNESDNNIGPEFHDPAH